MGKIIVIEGTDSSGKETQTNRLFEKLKFINKKVRKVSFPNYDSPACEPVKMYLSGKFGENPLNINPYPISAMYAIDRYASYKTDWEEFYNDDGIIITDRYVTSNMIHQGAKIRDKVEKLKYLNWLEDLEYDKILIPRPNIVIFLNMPIFMALKLMENRKNKINGEDGKDIHEKNVKYLENSYENACEISKIYNWKEIKCVNNDKLKSIVEIENEIFQVLEDIL
ncbi:MAG: deoxynucleoside kinase [Fusobacteriaceae bacterium]|jgi:dTMP kinase|nr:deoxynucleoside kinase [Fusobacteriaceae bacterium]